MSIRPLSIRRRGIADRTLRLSQPVPWSDGLDLSLLTINTATASATASATANFPGGWTQLFAAADTASTDTVAAVMFAIQGLNQTTTTDNSGLIDIGTGGTGSETVIAPDIAVGGYSTGFTTLLIPVRIAGATRIAMRARTAVASRQFRSIVTAGYLSGAALFSSPFADRLPTSLDSIGTTQSTSSATACSGASGSWTLITASTSKDYQAIAVNLSGPGNGSSVTAATAKIDVAIGASGSEVVLVTVPVNVGATNGYLGQLCGGYGIVGRHIPAGSRISVRHNLAANPQLVCVSLIGVPYA